MNELRKRLFECYDTHYLRANVLTGASLNVATYEQHIPDYEASFGSVISELPRASRVLDIGCGVGFLLFWLQHSRPGFFQLSGVDVSESQFALARKNLPEVIALFREEATTFLQRNAQSFSAIFCTDVLEHLETDDDLLELLELAREALLPGGLLVCQVPNMANLTGAHLRYIDMTHARGFTRLSLLQLLEGVGFRQCQIRKRKAADAGQWVRMFIENWAHRAIYRICGVGDERYFGKMLIGVGRA